MPPMGPPIPPIGPMPPLMPPMPPLMPPMGPKPLWAPLEPLVPLDQVELSKEVEMLSKGFLGWAAAMASPLVAPMLLSNGLGWRGEEGGGRQRGVRKIR